VPAVFEPLPPVLFVTGSIEFADKGKLESN